MCQGRNFFLSWMEPMESEKHVRTVYAKTMRQRNSLPSFLSAWAIARSKKTSYLTFPLEQSSALLTVKVSGTSNIFTDSKSISFGDPGDHVQSLAMLLEHKEPPQCWWWPSISEGWSTFLLTAKTISPWNWACCDGAPLTSLNVSPSRQKVLFQHHFPC